MSMGGKKTQPLISSRYAAMYVPNTEWVYMDALSKSDQTKAAFAKGEISTKGKNVTKYLELTAAERLRQYRESQRSTTPQPPTHIIELLKLQSPRGKFECLADVMKCLFMPSEVTYRHDEMFTEWEKATAFAIAAMRQQNEFFDYLCSAHDKAFAWMESNEIIFEARELLNAYQFASIEPAPPSLEEQHDASQELSTVLEEQPSEYTSLSSRSASQIPSNHGENYSGGAAGSSDYGRAANTENSAKMPFTLSTAQLAQAFQGLQTIEEVSNVSKRCRMDEDWA
jgi:hypothetical protein